jgi:acyl carrier protein
MVVSVEEVTALFRKACPNVDLGPGDEERPLKDLGVDSLDMANYLLEVQEHYGITVPDDDMPALRTIVAMTSYVGERTKGK